MITTTQIEINGNMYKETKSDTFKIKKVGTSEVYMSAIDILNSNFKYEETIDLLVEKNAVYKEDKDGRRLWREDEIENI